MVVQHDVSHDRLGFFVKGFPLHVGANDLVCGDAGEICAGGVPVGDFVVFIENKGWN